MVSSYRIGETQCERLDRNEKVIKRIIYFRITAESKRGKDLIYAVVVQDLITTF